MRVLLAKPLRIIIGPAVLLEEAKEFFDLEGEYGGCSCRSLL